MLILCLIGVAHVPCKTEISFKTMSSKWNLIVLKLIEYFKILKE